MAIVTTPGCFYTWILKRSLLVCQSNHFYMNQAPRVYNGKKNWSFTDFEKRFVKDNHGKLTMPEMAKLMGRTLGQVKGFVHRNIVCSDKKTENQQPASDDMWDPDENTCWITG